MQGKCHICEEQKDIKWCGICQHWFCGDCRTKYWHRGLEAVKQMIGGKKPGCCGPSLQEILKHAKVTWKHASRPDDANHDSQAPEA
jgi:hypothetical protein